MIEPCSWHDEVPQLTNTSFLPDGIGLPIGVVTVMSLGRFAPSAITAWALLTVELAPAPPDAALPELLSLDEPQAATPNARAAPIAATTRGRRDAGFRVDMGPPPSGWGCLSGGAAAQARPRESAGAG